jgi:Domain of unknown function (DUF397)
VVTAKPTVGELGIDPAAQTWRRSGHGAGAIEVAFTGPAASRAGEGEAPPPGETPGPGEASRPGGSGWVLMRVAGDPGHRILVFDRHEWACFLDGARNGEFDDGASRIP